MEKASLFLVFTLPAILLAQPIEEWVARYNGPGDGRDIARSIAVDDKGNVYVTGYSWGSGTHYDYATIKYDQDGNELWVARYNGPGNGDDSAYSIAVDNRGNVYVTGTSYDSGTNFDYATVKYDRNGHQLWVARYNGPGNYNDVAYSIAVDKEGNVYVTGGSDGGLDTWYDYATIKYDQDGNELWVARYNGPGNNWDNAYSIAVDNGGNVYVTGRCVVKSRTWFDYATVKYDRNGNQLWVAHYRQNRSDVAYSIAVDNRGNVYVTGYRYDSRTNNDYTTIKYDQNGNELWVARYNGPGNGIDVASSIALDKEGNVYVTGCSYGSGTHYDYATIKYDQNGNQLWVARYNGPGNSGDVASSIALDKEGNVYVTGYSYDSGTDNDYATVKYDQNGNELWVARYSGPKHYSLPDVAYSIAVDNKGNVYVTGISKSSGWDDFNYATVKYSQVTGIVEAKAPTGFALSCIKPNPFSENTVISYQLPIPTEVYLAVYDISGKLVKTLVSRHSSPGSYNVTWNGRDDKGKSVSAGIYFLELLTPKYKATKKITLLTR